MFTRSRRISSVLLIPAVLATMLCTAALGAKPAAAGAPWAAAPSAPLEAPLNPDFLRYQAQFPMSTPQWVATGLGFGLRPDPVDLSYARGLAKSRAVDRAYPSSFDLRATGKVTSVKTQDPYGTCWTFASLGSLESCLMPGQNLDFSEDNMVLTSGFDLGTTPVGAATPAQKYDFGGQLFMSTAYVARWSGPVYETDDPYGDGITPPGLTARVHVQDVSWWPARASATDNDNIKYAVSTYGGCYVAMKWDGPGSVDSTYLKITGMPHAAYYDDGSLGTSDEEGHAVLVVGWDDNFAASNFTIAPPGNGAFLVKNSWGPAWGPEGGFFWVSYYDTKFACTSAVGVFNGVEPVSNHAAIYQYDPLGWTTTIGTGSSPTYWGANVFNAQSTDSITAVGFYAVTPNCAYEIYAGASLDTKVLCTSGTIATMGFHTVALPSPAPVTAGQPFVVAIKLTTSGYPYPLAVENPWPNYATAATAAAGQSYISSNGTSWGDLPSSYASWANTNVCLKAYTAGTAAVADTTAPTTTASGIPASGWSKSAVTVSLSGDDGGGSGVAYTEYSLDGGAYARGTSVTVSATGSHTLAFHSTDNAGNVEAVQTTTIGVDPDGPRTVAYKNVTVKKGKTAHFRFKIADVTPTADMQIRIYKKARLRKILVAGATKTGSVMIGTWKCTLAKGTYTWKVYATDLAGNPQRVIGKKTLVVK
jgi:C1A family cysteine protease